MMQNNRALYSDRKFEVLKAVYKWRDTIGRVEDESPNFVLPNSYMFEIVNTLPNTKEELIKKCHKLQYVS